MWGLLEVMYRVLLLLLFFASCMCNLFPSSFPSIKVLKVFVDNPFPVVLLKHQNSVRCLDLSAR